MAAARAIFECCVELLARVGAVRNLLEREEISMRNLKILHFTPWDTECGIALYARDLIAALEQVGIAGAVFPVDIAAQRHMNTRQIRGRLAELCEHARQYDVLHIHHDYSFFVNANFKFRWSNANFMWLLRQLDNARVPTVVTFHVELMGMNLWEVGRRRRVGRFLGDWLRRKSALRLQNWQVPRGLRNDPQRFRAVTFSPRPQATYIAGGMDPSVMRVIPLAAPRACREVSELETQAAKERLGYPRDCTLLSLFGFVSAYKGCEWAVRALELLPENYHLALVGGRHRLAPQEPTLNRVLEIWHGRSPDRLRVTGFVSDEERDLYHVATDVCLSPYTWNELTASAAVTWGLTSGKPVVTSTIPCFDEINEAYDCLLTAAPGMVHELAWQIRRVAGSAALRQRLVQNAALGRRSFVGHDGEEIRDPVRGAGRDRAAWLRASCGNRAKCQGCLNLAPKRSPPRRAAHRQPDVP